MASHMTRRTALGSAVALGFAASSLGLTGKADAQAKTDMPAKANAQPPTVFTLPPLPYAFDALQPHIDAKTMELHHGKHHQAFINNLNTAAAEYPGLLNKPIQDILKDLASLPEAVRMLARNNLGGHANHSMYWQIMGKPGTKPDSEISAIIERDFGGLEKLQTAFNTAAAKVFGSGWAFVTVSSDGKLAIEARPNQDSPLMDGKRVLFGNDVWEHAYYLNYQNRRPDYLKSWWNVLNWDKVSERYKQAKAGTLVI